MLRVRPTLGLGLVLILGTQPARGEESNSPLPALGQRAAQLAAHLPPLPETLPAWEKHRAELVKQLYAALGLPERGPMSAAVNHTRPAGDLVIEEVVYHWCERTYTTATVIRGQQVTGRQPAIVMSSGWRGHYTFRPYRRFVDDLARRGILVLFIDDPRIGLRQAPPAGLYAASSAVGIQLAGAQVHDVLRGLDYLLTRADVDAGKIGLAGLGEGALHAQLAAALEPRFRFVLMVGGVTTLQALAQAGGEWGPEDPSGYLAGVLPFTDLDRVAACLTPRPVLIAGNGESGKWPATGQRQVLRTMKTIYGLAQAQDRLQQLPGESMDDWAPYVAEVVRWLETRVLSTLVGSDLAPAPCGKPEDPDFSLFRYVQRRAAGAATSQSTDLSSPAAWQTRRQTLLDWLRQACATGTWQPLADKVLRTSESDTIVTEQVVLGIDGDLVCPAVLLRPAQAGAAKRGGVILSHDDRQSAASARIAEAARQLATAGYCVIVPDHASVDPQGLQALATAESRSFYGDEFARLYGPADAVGLPPLALRVAEDLAAFRHLAARAEVDPAQIVVAGLGFGSVDAALAAALEERLAGAAVVGITTARDWIANVAPGQLRFVRLAPYLPGLLTKTDLDVICGAIAPRPLVLAPLKDGWPRSGFEQAVATVSGIYTLLQTEKNLSVLGPRQDLEQLIASQPEGLPKRLLAVARTLVPAPPQAGLVGTVDGVKPRAAVDGASGLIWVIPEMDGYSQEFTVSGYQLQNWSFCNRHGAAQQGRVVTPLIFKKTGDTYQLTGIGTTRTNAGTGAQTFPFEPVAGTAEVGEDHYFGFFTGDRDGKPNAGVIEYDEAPDARMTILIGDSPKLQVGAAYRLQAEYPRRYSVQAVAKKR